MKLNVLETMELGKTGSATVKGIAIFDVFKLAGVVFGPTGGQTWMTWGPFEQLRTTWAHQRGSLVLLCCDSGGE